jgi:hypothetical protein
MSYSFGMRFKYSRLMNLLLQKRFQMKKPKRHPHLHHLFPRKQMWKQWKQTLQHLEQLMQPQTPEPLRQLPPQTPLRQQQLMMWRVLELRAQVPPRQ